MGWALCPLWFTIVIFWFYDSQLNPVYKFKARWKFWPIHILYNANKARFPRWGKDHDDGNDDGDDDDDDDDEDEDDDDDDDYDDDDDKDDTLK